MNTWFRSLCATLGVSLLAACGLKAALELPERTGNVVIRGPGTAGTTAAPPSTSPGPAPASVPADEDPDRLPPPPLPGGNPGTARGG